MGAMIAFGFLYNTISPLQTIVDKGVDPAVNGLTLLYSKITTPVYRFTKIDLGFVNMPADQEFMFNVRLATYINQRKATPLLDIAIDSRFSEDQRIRALRAILKFEQSSDWVQPFLNELPKGGLLGLYDEEAPLLDEIIKKIREQGGVRQPLVRAYAEVVFAFMLQVPDLLVRRHACNWVSDVMAEDALFLLIPRFAVEKDPKGQLAIEEALLNIRAVSEPENAREQLLPYYKKPSWPTLRLPIAVVLARLGYDNALVYLNHEMRSESLTKEQRAMVALGLARAPYPRQLKVSEEDERLLAERKRGRDEQIRVAMERREKIQRQEQLRQQILAKAEAEKAKAIVSAPVEEKKQEPVQAEPKKKPTRIAMVSPAVVAPPPSPVTKIPPRNFPVPGTHEQVPTEPTAVETKPAATERPEDTNPPVLEEAPKTRSLMNYVDIVFEVKKQNVPLFQNPGEGPTGVSLPVGTKGKADFEMLIGEDKWYQVKSKKGEGWANGKNLSIFNLSPQGVTPAAEPPTQAHENIEGARKESTYFEAATENAPYFDKPSDRAKEVGTLASETAYMAIKSEKVDSDRWFLLQIRSGVTGWARGLDLRLAEVKQPSQLETPRLPMSQRGKKSEFRAEWAKATVKGVGVYSRPSIAAKMLQQINPPTIYQVIEISGEWYKIDLGKTQGWVQSMDVSLTKKE